MINLRVAACILLFLTCCLVKADSPVSTETKLQYCVNENDDSILNKCFRETPPGFLTMVSNYILQFVNPRAQAIVVLGILLVHPFLHFGNAKKGLTKDLHQSFQLSRLDILNYLHRLGYTLTLDVVIYSVFRQSRPCRCTTDGVNFQHIGSIYGMPSGDAMAGGILGATIFDAAPFGKKFSIPLAILTVVGVAAERVILGYHTVAQVTIGNLLAFLLHIYSTRAPQYCIIIDTVFQFLMGVVLLNIDPALVYGFQDTHNLFAWFVWGVSFNVLVTMVISRMFWPKNNRHMLKKNVAEISEDNQCFELVEYVNTPKKHKIDIGKAADGYYIAGAVVVFAVINFVASLYTEYNIFGRS